MKALKITISTVILLIIAVYAGLSVYLKFFFNPKDYSQKISTAFTKATGRQLSLNGKISINIFPRPAVNISQVEISNPKNISTTIAPYFMKIQTAQASLQMLPLFLGKLMPNSFSLDHADIYLIKTRNSNNWSMPSTNPAPTTTQTKRTQNHKSHTALATFVFPVNIINSTAHWIDTAKNQRSDINDITLKINPSDLGRHIKLAGDLVLNNHQQGLSTTINLSSSIDADWITKTFNLNSFLFTANFSATKKTTTVPPATRLSATGVFSAKQSRLKLTNINLSADNNQLAGKASVSNINKHPNIKFLLTAKNLDLNALSSSNPPQASSSTHARSQKITPGILIPVAILRAYDWNGQINLKNLHVKNLDLKNSDITSSGHNGNITLNLDHMQIDKGEVNINSQFDALANQSRLTFTLNIKAVPLKTLLSGLASYQKFSGTLNMQSNLKSYGISTTALTKNLSGNGRMTVNNGQLQGIDLEYVLKQGVAKISKQAITDNGNSNETNFTAMTTSYQVNNGIINNSNITLTANKLSLTGTGSTNLVTSNVNYHLNANYNYNNKAWSIPLMVHGTLMQPKVGLDLQAIAKSLLNGMGHHLMDNVFKNLFNRK